MSATVQLYGAPGDQLALVLFAQELEEFLVHEGVRAQIEVEASLLPDL